MPVSYEIVTWVNGPAATVTFCRLPLGNRDAPDCGSSTYSPGERFTRNVPSAADVNRVTSASVARLRTITVAESGLSSQPGVGGIVWNGHVGPAVIVPVMPLSLVGVRVFVPQPAT